MSLLEFDIFKIEYNWYEGEHVEILLGKNVEREEFEKDILDARNYAQSLIGKEDLNGNNHPGGYSVECLPEYYNKIVNFLVEKRNYVLCHLEGNISYEVDDNSNGEKITIIRKEDLTKRDEL